MLAQGLLQGHRDDASVIRRELSIENRVAVTKPCRLDGPVDDLLMPLENTLAAFALAIATTTSAFGAAPSFSLAWSEYPSWSVFGVAHAAKLIDGAAGKQGPIEQKWNVDIVLKEPLERSPRVVVLFSQALQPLLLLFP